MDRQILNFTANEQILVCDNPIKISTNKVNYIEARFDLGQNWSGYDSVRAVWFNDFQCISTVLDSQGVTFVPFEVMKRRGNVKVNLVGSISEDDVLTDRLTSYPVVAVIVDCIAQITGANTSPITPSEYEQFVASVRNDADRAEAGATSAETYASNAESSADNALLYSQNSEASAIRASGYALDAQGYAQNASESAQNAETYASEAEDARDEIRNMSANATTLPSLSLGIPQGIQGEKGDNGDTGATPNLTIGTVETLEPTESATATITGTDENPVLNLGLPKGEQGEVSLDELLQNTIVQTNSDSVPYNFRPTPSCGSLEYDEIVGASVGWNQLVQNGDFSDGTSHWRGAYGNINATDGELTYEIVSTGINFFDNQVSQGVLDSRMNIPANHVIFLNCETYAPNDNEFYMSVRTNSVGQSGVGITRVRPTPNKWSKFSKVGKTTGLVTDIAFYWSMNTNYAVGDQVKLRNAYIIDLTAMFGTTIANYVYSLEQANAGAGVAWLKSHFPCFNSYQPYNAGSIESVNGLQSHEMVGVNQWDEEWEVGSIYMQTGGDSSTAGFCRSKYFRVFPNATYFMKCPTAMSAFFYDENKAYLGDAYFATPYNSTFTTPPNATYMRFRNSVANTWTPYNHDICINLSDASRNGQYEPYVKHSYPLDSTLTLRGIPKIADGKMYYDGDEYESDGTVTRKYGIVDLGTLGYTPLAIGEADARFLCNSINSTLKPAPSNSTLANVICAKYPTASVSARPDKSICVYADSGFIIRDSAFSDVETLKNALSGTYLVYEMKTPTTETATPYTNPQASYDGGTEEYVSDCIVPIGHETEYPMTFSDTMPTADGTYTMSVTITNGKRTINWT